MYTATASVLSKDIRWFSSLPVGRELASAVGLPRGARLLTVVPCEQKKEKRLFFFISKSSESTANRAAGRQRDALFHFSTLHRVTIRMDSIAAEFGEGRSLYEILDVPSTATPASIKKAYFKLALTCVS